MLGVAETVDTLFGCCIESEGGIHHERFREVSIFTVHAVLTALMQFEPVIQGDIRQCDASDSTSC